MYFFVPPLQVRCDGARRNREGAGGGRSDFKGKLVPLRECFHASLVTRPLQLPFVLRAIKSVPLDDPEVCRIIIRRKILSCLLHEARSVVSLPSGHICVQVASHVSDILARTARLSAVSTFSEFMQKPV